MRNYFELESGQVLGRCAHHDVENVINVANSMKEAYSYVYKWHNGGGARSQTKVKYNNKTRKVNVDNQGHRYIRMGGEIVYLKTIRGQYRYL